MKAMIPEPTEIHVDRSAKTLHVSFDDGARFDLSFEYLRVFSPSAEVRGHAPEQAVLQTGKRGVGIERVEAMGNYAVQINFDDGHRTGIYTWEWLYELGSQQDKMWASYLQQLKDASGSRDPV